MGRFVNVLFMFLNIALFCVLGFLYLHHGLQAGGPISVEELITIVLGALATLLTALGLFIAALAIWGYARLSANARESATAAAKEHVGNIVPGLVSAAIVAQYGVTKTFGESATEEGGENVRKAVDDDQ